MNGSEVLQSSEVAYGETPVYTGDAPTKTDPTGQYSYSFAGWAPAITTVTGEATYTAQFNSTVNEYTITFVNDTGAELQKSDFEYGKTPIYEGNTPAKDPSATKVYTFDGWQDKDDALYKIGEDTLPAVEGATTYTAHYDATDRTYTVSFVVNGTVAQTIDTLIYEDVPSFDGVPSMDSDNDDYIYVFTGWENGNDKYTADEDLPGVTVDGTTYTATFEKWYRVSIGQLVGGSVSADEEYYRPGADVTLSVDYDFDKYSFVEGSLVAKKAQGTIEVPQVDGEFVFTMPEEAVTVDAEFIRIYDIWIGETQVNEENLTDVLGDGSVSCSYDETNNVWTMKFASQPTFDQMDDETAAMIDFCEDASLIIETPEDGLTLNMVGACTGIIFESDGELTISGNLDIQIASGGEASDGWLSGIDALSNVTIDGNLKIVIAEAEPAMLSDGVPGMRITGLSADGTIEFVAKDGEAREWDITVPDSGIALFAREIIIPQSYGIKTPEGGEIIVLEPNNTIGDVSAESSAMAIATKNEDGSEIIANEVSIRQICHVTFKNGNETLADDNFFIGDTPEINLEKEPEKEPDQQYTYGFAGWEDGNGQYPKDGDLPELTGDVTFTAFFEKTVNKYKVTFVDEDGTELKAAVEYDYGTKAADIQKPVDPTKEATAEKTFGFGGWTPEIADVTGDVTYKATYVDANAKYKVTFVDEDGTELKAAVEYDYGTKAASIAKPTDPTKAADEKYTYEFSGWSPEISDVINNATYKATYKAIEKKVEKGVYKYIGEAAKYTKGSKKAVTIIFKRTENDEITFDMFAGVKTAKGALTSGKQFTAKKGSVEITLLPEYLETLEVGKTAFTVSFQDGDPVTIELEVAPAQQQADTNPTTGDSMNMNYIWIILALGAAALAIVIFVQIRRRREEEF